MQAKICFLSQAQHLRFESPLQVLQARTLAEVAPALAAAEAGVAQGLWAAGFIAYEAAPAFDPALPAHAPQPGLPLAWFGLFKAPAEAALPLPGAASALPRLSPRWQQQEYLAAFARAQAAIASGECYQLNLTFPLDGRWPGQDAEALWQQLWLAQPCGHAAFLDWGAGQLLSLSPELLFEKQGRHLIVRPMKGTRRRGLWPAQDQALRAELLASGKERAENVMIVDLLRSDLGKVCGTGSVAVSRLFEAEAFRTVWQMTSTVQGESSASIPQVLAALFPSGSVTGAPKARAMHWIKQLEPGPRGAYCGSLGWWSPDGRASFNVAIRTLTLAQGRACYPVGSGVTAAAKADEEWQECLLKAEALGQRPMPRDFELLESLRWEPARGYWLLKRHLDRLLASASMLSFKADEASLRQALAKAEPALAALDGEGWRVARLALDAQGQARVRVELRPDPPQWKLAWAKQAVDPADPFLYHKTTQRQVYDQALAGKGDAQDVLLHNTLGQLTETCRANIALKIDSRLYTPPVECGLLAGTLRAELLEQGELEERVLTKKDLAECQALYILNAVRGLVRAELSPPAPAAP
jgi:para-aminobenzoate synthetase/4-amino-4-deoxychorismate lyase